MWHKIRDTYNNVMLQLVHHTIIFSTEYLYKLTYLFTINIP